MGFYRNSNVSIKLFDSAALSGVHKEIIRKDLIAVNELRRFNFPDGHEVILQAKEVACDSCSGCWLKDKPRLLCPECSKEFRDDNNNIIFEQVEL